MQNVRFLNMQKLALERYPKLEMSIIKSGNIYLSREHVQELQELETAVLDSHGCCTDDSMQRFLSHQHEGHQPAFYITFRFHWFLKLSKINTHNFST